MKILLKINDFFSIQKQQGSERKDVQPIPIKIFVDFKKEQIALDEPEVNLEPQPEDPIKHMIEIKQEEIYENETVKCKYVQQIPNESNDEASLMLDEFKNYKRINEEKLKAYDEILEM